MILLLAQPEDGLAKALHAALRSMSLPVCFSDTKVPVSASGWTWHATATVPRGSLRNGGAVVEFEELHGVLAREHEPFTPDVGMNEANQHYVRSELRACLHAFLDALPCPIINRLSAPVMRRPFLFAPGVQAAVRASGLKLVEALVTPEVNEARSFLGRVPFLAGSLKDRHPPTPPGPTVLEELLRVKAPAYFIRLPVGDLLRLQVVGQAVVAAECAEHPTAPWHEVTAPTRLGGRAVELTRRLGLGFAQLTLGGPSWETCLDVDALPSLEAVGTGPRGRVVEALARLLAGGRR